MRTTASSLFDVGVLGVMWQGVRATHEEFRFPGATLDTAQPASAGTRVKGMWGINGQSPSPGALLSPCTRPYPTELAGGLNKRNVCGSCKERRCCDVYTFSVGHACWLLSRVGLHFFHRHGPAAGLPGLHQLGGARQLRRQPHRRPQARRRPQRHHPLPCVHLPCIININPAAAVHAHALVPRQLFCQQQQP